MKGLAMFGTAKREAERHLDFLAAMATEELLNTERLAMLAMRAARNGEDSLTPEEHNRLMCWIGFNRATFEKLIKE